MTAPSRRFSRMDLRLADKHELDQLLDEFEAACRRRDEPRIEEFLARAQEHLRATLFSELLSLELAYRQQSGQEVDTSEYRARFPEYGNIVDGIWRRPAEQVNKDVSTSDFSREHDTRLEEMTDAERLPERIGKFAVERRLGQGGFAVVYLARDEDLDRRVALKVPRPDRFEGEEDIARFVEEARKAAGLDHPAIVPVLHVHHDSESVYIVQKYIDGQDLAAYASKRTLSPREIAELMVQVAGAVGHAHRAHLTHRDLKCANILVDSSGRPFVADFGLAVHASHQRDHRGEFAGSLPYMAPEQVRGEVHHRLDGRTDIWALGVILSELLTGERPFQGEARTEIIDEIKHRDPRPPRQINPDVPRELERICQVCLEKRAVDRYQSAADLVEELQQFLDQEAKHPATEVDEDFAAPAKVIPKGLRSFDAEDAGFFLDLLPGPRDRDGLPQNVRFWKTRIEETDLAQTFSVGLLYGPSGCGKSSLVKAGLLPRLAGHVVHVYVEATANDTEVRLVKGLRQACRDLPGTSSLPDIMSSLRERGAGGGKKVIIVLDQFEQWLHAHDAESGDQLVDALRQCDGRHVQCLLLVRDDFWMSITRFMQALEIPLVEGQNSAAVDLFDADHVKKVLTAFGRAYGKLPDEDLTPEQTAFMDEAVAGLAEDGKIISVRLAVFAQMMQGRAWTPEGLHEVGGTAGVGVTFLEETFSARTAPPQYRVHEEGVRAVLKALLPESGTGIKGQMQSREQLMEAAEYSGRPSEFDTLLGILDREVRLITPTEPDATGRREVQSSGVARGQEDPTTEDTEHTVKKGEEVDLEASDDSHHPSVASVPSVVNDRQGLAEPASVFYQLTHDYLVPSLREWLTRKQKETRRGRAELRLADLAAAWNRQTENRHLPSLLEYTSIRRLTRKDRWTNAERRLMGRAGKVWTTRATIAFAVLVMVVSGGLVARDRILAHQARIAEESLEQQNATRAADLVAALLAADVQQVPQLINELEPLRPWADPLLRDENVAAAAQTREKLHTSLALLPVDDEQVDYRVQHLLATDHPPEVPVIVGQLGPHADALEPRLWAVMDEQGDQAGPRRLRAACALAAFDPDDSRWAAISDDVADELVGVSTLYLQTWMEALRRAGNHIAAAVVDIFADAERAPLEHSMAKDVLVDYGRDSPAVLAQAIETGDLAEFAELFPLLAAHADQAVPLLEAFVREELDRDWQDGPLDPAWTDPTEELTAAIEAAGGMIAERFAYCRTLSLDEFENLAQKLASCGYRPHRVRPYVADGATNVAATWQRDGRARRWLRGSAEEIRQRDQQLSAEGFQPFDVTASRDSSATAGATPRFAAIWVAAREGEPERRLLIGLTTEEAASATGELAAEGFAQRVGYAVVPLESGDAVVSVILAEGESAESELHAGTGSFRFGDIHLHLLQQDLQVTGAPPWQWLFVTGPSPSHQTATWVEDIGYESTVLVGLAPAEQVTRSRALEAADYRPVAIDVIESADGALLTSSLWHRPIIPEAVKDDLAQRQANAAVALLRMGEGAAVWPLLRHREYPEDFRHPDDPRLRTYLIHRLSPHGANPQDLIAQFGVEDDVSIRRALLLALGEFTSDQVDHSARQTFSAELSDVYRRHPDAGLHAAAAWLLRRWGRADLLQEAAKDLTENEGALLARQAQSSRNWYVTGEGQTMVVVEPGELLVGSHRSTDSDRFTDEPLHRKRIARRFALAATEVTRAQYRRFQEARPGATIDLVNHPSLSSIVRTDDSPQTAMTWYEAAAYCNWLSEQEGIAPEQWVYQPNGLGEFGSGMQIRDGYQNLVGYRLPSEVEWEYACRAGAVTSRYYGYADGLLDRYAWFDGNSEGHTWPVGQLKPNDLGLFDMHGNAWNWCHNHGGTWSAFVLEDPEDSEEDVEDGMTRVLRGGSFDFPARNVRAALRSSLQPDYRFSASAFRPARTLPPVPFTPLPPSSAAEGGARSRR